MSLAVYHPLMKRTGVCSLTKSEHRPSSDLDSTSTRPRLDLDPDMTRPDPGRDPKSSTDFADLEVDPQISPRTETEPSSSFETPNLARDFHETSTGMRRWRSSPSVGRLMVFQDFLSFLVFLETSEVAGPGPNPREIDISFGADGPLACVRGPWARQEHLHPAILR